MVHIGCSDAAWQVQPQPQQPCISCVHRVLAQQVCGELPAFLTRMDGHSALANSAALRAAGITGATPDPDHGHIEKDPSGQPTGLLR